MFPEMMLFDPSCFPPGMTIPEITKPKGTKGYWKICWKVDEYHKHEVHTYRSEQAEGIKEFIGSDFNLFVDFIEDATAPSEHEHKINGLTQNHTWEHCPANPKNDW